MSTIEIGLLVFSFLLVATLLAFILVNRMAIIHRLRFLEPLFLASTTVSLILLVITFRWTGLTISDSLGLAGLIFSFLFGLYGSKFLERRRRALLSIVVPSKAAFNNEARRGLFGGLETLPVEIDDPFDSVVASYEDLPAFNLAMQKAALARPDYVVLNAPSAAQLDSEECTQAITAITSRGGRIICMEMAPSNIKDYEGLVTQIYSEVDVGASILAQYAVEQIPPNGTALLLAGPEYSAEANRRKKAIEECLQGAEGRHHDTYSLPGWTDVGCYQRTRECLRNGQTPDVIICGNDTMALGAVRAIRELSQSLSKKPKVFGYDGIPQAIIAIAQLESPFYATIRTPPSAFGEMAAYIIRLELTGIRRPSLENSESIIHIDGANLVSKDNADRILEYITAS